MRGKLKYYKIMKIKPYLASKLSDIECTMLINVKMPTIYDILTFMSMIYFRLS